MGHRVILVYPIPEVGWNVPQKVLAETSVKSLLEIQMWLNSGGLQTSLDLYFSRTKKAFDAYESLGENERLLRIYPHLIFCRGDSRRCAAHNRDVFYYSDDNHLSHAGAMKLIDHVLYEASVKWKIQTSNIPLAAAVGNPGMSQ